ncbi:tetratricopeptide repeat protein [Leptospira sp. 201903071]|uniref:tetratricopeptide repeat protein n=1 Tax=Leptospira ainazelensis TaxID=2810034 RepID=UPI001963FB21|nr:tetratricopeptide repeat protein [Leptospira ainazelensis]MBM9499995.1 tetratricopeptide repeat protein [Leptospira ainazelensis]
MKLLSSKFCIFFVLSFAGFHSIAAQTKQEFGWAKGSDGFSFNLNGRTVFQSNTEITSFPDSLSLLEKSDFLFYAGEYYILNKDVRRYESLLKLTNNAEPELVLGGILLRILKELNFNSKESSRSLLSQFAKNEKTPYLKELAEGFDSSVFERKSPENLKCSRKNVFYSLCKTLRLKKYLADFKADAKSHEREYLNLNRTLAPFLEDPELKYIPFLNNFIFNIADQLAELGLSKEAVHFQKILIISENLSGRIIGYSYEKLAYYYLIGGDLVSAEKVLDYILKYHPDLRTPYKNHLYLKLGTIAYLNQDYKKSLDYYLNLDFLEWSSTILNPFLGEPISINSARDLISMAIWRTKSSFKAVDALKSVSTPKNLTEDDLFTRLRIIQILMNDEPEVAGKMATEITFLAQSKGWKRVEYSSTLLNGFIHYKKNDLRKAIIEFTKAYGILKSADPVYTEEWIRLTGLFYSHKESRSLKTVKGALDQAIAITIQRRPDDMLLQLKNYLPAVYGVREFTDAAINYYITHGHTVELLGFLSRLEQKEVMGNNSYPNTLVSIIDTSRRISSFRGFYPGPKEHLTSSRSEIRKTEVTRLLEEFDPFRNQEIRRSHIPVLSVFVRDKRTYIFWKPADSQELELKEIPSESASSFTVQTMLKSLVESSSKNESMQIYLNVAGMESFDYLKKEFPDIDFRLFTKFSKKEDNPKIERVYVGDCKSGDSPVKPNFEKIGSAYFEGNKLLTGSHSMIVWNLKVDNNSPGSLNEYAWNCGEDQIRFSRLHRRYDFRNTPQRLLFTRDSLSGNGWKGRSEDFLDWVSFWINSGVNRMYYIKSIDLNSESDINLLEKLSQETNEPEASFRGIRIRKHIE